MRRQTINGVAPFTTNRITMDTFEYLVRLNDYTLETFKSYNRAHQIGRIIRAHAIKAGHGQWRRNSSGEVFYAGPGQVIERLK